MMTVGIYDPYLTTLGGGERYVLSIAEYFSRKASVDILWHEPKIEEKIRLQFNMAMDRVHFLPFKKNVFKKYTLLRKYDAFFYVTDGSLFFSPVSKSFLIIQSPAHIPDNKTLTNRFKLKSWKTLLCYSDYVRKMIENRLKRKVTVLAPPVDVEAFRKGKKENIILTTGRFFSFLHSKKQDFLVDSFIRLYKSGKAKNWRFVLIGSVQDESAERYIKKIKEKAVGYPITIISDAAFEVLKTYYAKAKIFWLATGYGEDLYRYPERAEHFGIVTVEAMAAKCVPIVFKAGGQLEIINHGRTGYLFETEEDLHRFTIELIKDEVKRKKIAKSARLQSLNYSKEVFFKKLEEITRG